MVAVVFSLNFEIEEVHLFRDEKAAHDGAWEIVQKWFPGYSEFLEEELSKLCRHSFPCNSFKEHFLKTLDITTRWYDDNWKIDIVPSHHVHTND